MKTGTLYIYQLILNYICSINDTNVDGVLISDSQGLLLASKGNPRTALDVAPIACAIGHTAKDLLADDACTISIETSNVLYTIEKNEAFIVMSTTVLK